MHRLNSETIIRHADRVDLRRWSDPLSWERCGEEASPSGLILFPWIAASETASSILPSGFHPASSSVTTLQSFNWVEIIWNQSDRRKSVGNLIRRMKVANRRVFLGQVQREAGNIPQTSEQRDKPLNRLVPLILRYPMVKADGYLGQEGRSLDQNVEWLVGADLQASKTVATDLQLVSINRIAEYRFLECRAAREHLIETHVQEEELDEQETLKAREPRERRRYQQKAAPQLYLLQRSAWEDAFGDE